MSERGTWYVKQRSRNHNSPSPVHARNFRYFHIRSIFSLYVAWDSIVESLSESTLARLRVRALYFHGRHSRNVFTYSHRGLSFKLFTTMGCEGIRVSGKGSLLYELHSFREKRKEKWEWLEERKRKKKKKGTEWEYGLLCLESRAIRNREIKLMIKINVLVQISFSNCNWNYIIWSWLKLLWWILCSRDNVILLFIESYYCLVLLFVTIKSLSSIDYQIYNFEI